MPLLPPERSHICIALSASLRAQSAAGSGVASCAAAPSGTLAANRPMAMAAAVTRAAPFVNCCPIIEPPPPELLDTCGQAVPSIERPGASLRLRSRRDAYGCSRTIAYPVTLVQRRACRMVGRASRAGIARGLAARVRCRRAAPRPAWRRARGSPRRSTGSRRAPTGTARQPAIRRPPGRRGSGHALGRSGTVAPATRTAGRPSGPSSDGLERAAHLPGGRRRASRRVAGRPARGSRRCGPRSIATHPRMASMRASGSVRRGCTSTSSVSRSPGHPASDHAREPVVLGRRDRLVAQAQRRDDRSRPGSGAAAFQGSAGDSTTSMRHASVPGVVGRDGQPDGDRSRARRAAHR